MRLRAGHGHGDDAGCAPPGLRRFVDGPDLGPWTDESPDQELLDGASTPLEQVLKGYSDQARRTDEIIARHQLDDLSATPLHSGVRPTLRWVLQNGHLDLLRDLADGSTGQ